MSMPSFLSATDNSPVEIIPGITRRNIALTADMHLIEVHGDAGVALPMHSHPHQQVGYVVSGELTFTIGGETRTLTPGDSYTIPGGVEHGATFNVDCVVLDCFTPVREDYLD